MVTGKGPKRREGLGWGGSMEDGGRRAGGLRGGHCRFPGLQSIKQTIWKETRSKLYLVPHNPDPSNWRLGWHGRARMRGRWHAGLRSSALLWRTQHCPVKGLACVSPPSWTLPLSLRTPSLEAVAERWPRGPAPGMWLALAVYFTYGKMHVSMLFSQEINF